MDQRLRDAWTRVIDPDDIDRHLHNVGQARANAELVAEMLVGPASGRVLFAGAGTGQMFDYVDASFLADRDVVFTDINQRYLAKLHARLADSRLRYCTTVDDIEESRLAGPFDVVVAVLVLEHVEWRKAVRTMAGWQPRQVHIVTQRNPPDMATAVTPGRELPPSLAEFARMAHPVLVSEGELREAMAALGFHIDARRERPVADGKAMVGTSFTRL